MYSEDIHDKFITLGEFIVNLFTRTDIPIYEDKGREWDGDAAEKRLRKWASSDGSGDKDKMNWGKYARGFAYVDESDKENFGSYKLPFCDIIDGKIYAIFRGVAAAIAALNGARGGIKISREEKEKAYRKLARYYRKWGEEPPELRAIIEKKLENNIKEKEEINMEELKALQDKMTALENEFKKLGETLAGLNTLMQKRTDEDAKYNNELAELKKTIATIDERLTKIENTRTAPAKTEDVDVRKNETPKSIFSGVIPRPF